MTVVFYFSAVKSFIMICQKHVAMVNSHATDTSLSDTFLPLLVDTVVKRYISVSGRGYNDSLQTQK